MEIYPASSNARNHWGSWFCNMWMILMMLPASSNGCNHWGSWFCNIWSLGGPCGYTQLMLMMLPSCLVKCAQSSGQLVLMLKMRRNHWGSSLGGPCGRKYTQLMLMMLPSCLVKCAQSLGQLVLQHLESRGGLWPEIYPADAHDAPLSSRQMRASTGAVGFATSGV